MFTLLVLWLLVACIPGLLMLATLGLGRLERMLARDDVPATNVAPLDQAQALDMRTLAREGMPEALEYLHRRQAQVAAAQPPKALTGRHHAESFLAADSIARVEPGPPTYVPANREWRYRNTSQVTVTRHVNRV